MVSQSSFIQYKLQELKHSRFSKAPLFIVYIHVIIKITQQKSYTGFIITYVNYSTTTLNYVIFNITYFVTNLEATAVAGF